MESDNQTTTNNGIPEDGATINDGEREEGQAEDFVEKSPEKSKEDEKEEEGEITNFKKVIHIIKEIVTKFMNEPL